MAIENKNTGFTLIEIMLTVAIIGILSSIAIPSYNHYVKKAKAEEVVKVYDLFRVHMMDFHIKNGRFPSIDDGTWIQRNALVGLADKGSFESDVIKQAWISNQSGIKIQLKDTSLSESNSNRFLAKGEKVNGRFVWYCNYKAKNINGWKSTVDDKYLPARCHNN